MSNEITLKQRPLKEQIEHHLSHGLANTGAITRAHLVCLSTVANELLNRISEKDSRIKELEEENKIQKENIRAVLSPDHTSCQLTEDHLREENQKLKAELDESRKEIIKLELSKHHPFQHDFVKDEKYCETCRRIKKLKSRHAQQGGKNV